MARVAIVTGAETGIGRAAAVGLARAGCDVGVTWYQDEDAADRTAERVRAAGRRAQSSHLDVTLPDQAVGTLEELAGALGGLDVMVNNAGIAQTTPFLELRLEDWRRVLEVDLTGAFVCAQAAARRMVAQGRGGRIINVTSVHESVPLRHAAAYCAAKGGLGLLTKVMALELADAGITVNSVAPGATATRMTGAEDLGPAARRRPGIPLGRLADATEVASAIVFLSSPEASYVTGASLVVDGGLLLIAAEANRLAKPGG